MLVNNAGSLRAIGPLWEVDPDDWWADVHDEPRRRVQPLPRCAAGNDRARRGPDRQRVSYAGARSAPYQTATRAGRRPWSTSPRRSQPPSRPTASQAFAVAPGYTETELTRDLTGVGGGTDVAPRRWAHGRVRRCGASSARADRRASPGAAADALSGRLLHALDDLDDLLARIDEIRERRALRPEGPQAARRR